jgi:hypothetical protein
MLEKFIDNPCEDSLTASVFTHLLYLPSEVFWQILWQACHTASLPRLAGELNREVEFWPKWKADDTRNSRYVEPDLFLRFPNFDLIIEAKRHDDFQQDRGQWKNEVIAYHNEYGTENVPVRLIAMGGIWDTKDEVVTLKDIICPVHMCRWSRLLDECQRMYRELGRITYPSSAINANRRILADLINLFERHGFQTGTWFADLVPKLTPLTMSLSNHHRVFQRTHSQFSTP